MKKSTRITLAVACASASILTAGIAIAQGITPGLIQAGKTTLPAGQYVLTNINTGQALYMEIDGFGKMHAQEPRSLRISVSSTGGPLYSDNSGLGSQPGFGNTQSGFGNTQPGFGNTAQPQQGGMWGGLLKKGVDSLLQPNPNAQQ